MASGSSPGGSQRYRIPQQSLAAGARLAQIVMKYPTLTATSPIDFDFRWKAHRLGVTFDREPKLGDFLTFLSVAINFMSTGIVGTTRRQTKKRR